MSPMPQPPTLPPRDLRSMYNNSSGDGEIDQLGNGLANSSLEDDALHKIVIGVDFGTTYTGEYTELTVG
jgi:hypothetical protein